MAKLQAKGTLTVQTPRGELVISPGHRKAWRQWTLTLDGKEEHPVAQEADYSTEAALFDEGFERVSFAQEAIGIIQKLRRLGFKLDYANEDRFMRALYNADVRRLQIPQMRVMAGEVDLRHKLIRLAHARPELRAEILPLLSGRRVAAKMRSGTEAEFQKVLANAGWPRPEYAHTKRTMDAWYKDRGTEVAHKTQMLTRGKVTNESYMINPDYLEKGRKGSDPSSSLDKKALSPWSHEDAFEKRLEYHRQRGREWVEQNPHYAVGRMDSRLRQIESGMLRALDVARRDGYFGIAAGLLAEYAWNLGRIEAAGAGK